MATDLVTAAKEQAAQMAVVVSSFQAVADHIAALQKQATATTNDQLAMLAKKFEVAQAAVVTLVAPASSTPQAVTTASAPTPLKPAGPPAAAPPAPPAPPAAPAKTAT